MEKQYVKAKECLNKEFYMMQIQADAARAKGKVLMEKEDIEYILSLQGLGAEDYTRYSEIEVGEDDFESYVKATEQKYDSNKLLEVCVKAKEEGYQGVTLYNDVSNKDRILLESNDYFVHYAGYGSSFWCEILLSEEAFIRHQILNFQHMFGTIKEVASLIAKV